MSLTHRVLTILNSSVPHVNLPPIMRESQLPPGAMSSAQLQDAAQEEQFHDDASVGGDGIERLQ